MKGLTQETTEARTRRRGGQTDRRRRRKAPLTTCLRLTATVVSVVTMTLWARREVTLLSSLLVRRLHNTTEHTTHTQTSRVDKHLRRRVRWPFSSRRSSHRWSWRSRVSRGHASVTLGRWLCVAWVHTHSDNIRHKMTRNSSVIIDLIGKHYRPNHAIAV